jgi:O-antigen/teichoic acid export membrane protein/glycosyltransferase involved in cell wall biosynthesis
MRLLVMNATMDADHPILGFTTRWVAALAARVESVDVITLTVGRLELPDNVRVFSLGKERGYGHPRMALEFYRLLLRLTAGGRIGGCFSHMTQRFSAMAGPVLRMRGIPLVTWYAHPSLTLSLRVAHLMSNRMVTSLPSTYPFRRGKLRVIGQGINVELFTPAPDGARPPEAPVLLCAGRLSPVKDHPTLIRAVALARARLPAGFRLVIVGDQAGADEDYPGRLRRLAAELGVDDCVEFRPGVPMHALVEAYRGAAAYVNLTTVGSGDKVAWEAMSCGVPTLLANPDFAETLGTCAESLLFTHGSAESLADRLVWLMALPAAERRAIGAYLRGQVVALHGLPELSARILTVLDECGPGRRAHAAAPPAAREEGAMTGAAAPAVEGRRRRGGLTGSGAMMAGSQYVSVGIGLLTTVAASRLLGAAEYGVAALVLSFPSLLWSFVSVKPGTVVTRYLAQFRAAGRVDDIVGICRMAYLVDLVTALVVLGLCAATSAWVAAHVYRLPGLQWLMLLYGTSFLFLSFVGTSKAVLATWQHFRTWAALELFERVLVLLLTVGLLWKRPTVSSFVIATTVAQALTGLASLVAAGVVLRRGGIHRWWRRRLPLPAELRREALSFFGWNYLLVTLGGVLAQVPLIALGRFRGPNEAGYYRLALTLVTVGSYTEMALGRVYYPLLCEQWAGGERATIRQRLRRWTLRIGLPLGGALALGTLLMPFLIPLVFGAEFRPAVRGAQVMMIGAVVGTVFFWQTPLYNAAGRFALLTKVNAVYTAAVVGVILLVASPMGFVGVAAATSLGKLACTVALLAMATWTPDDGPAASPSRPASTRPASALP